MNDDLFDFWIGLGIAVCVGLIAWPMIAYLIYLAIF